ncbi:MAG TPA: hypothetical protein VGA38_13275, partial [Candidatus Limnocylindria bacterium]
GDIIEGGDHLKHYAACGHSDINPLMSHSTGIAAHVAIYLKPCRDIWAAYRAILAIKPIPGLHVEKVHISLGEIDMLADIHAMWTDGFDDENHRHERGRETRLIGDWVNQVRQVHPDDDHDHDESCDCCYVARTSTNVCMVPDY